MELTRIGGDEPQRETEDAKAAEPAKIVSLAAARNRRAAQNRPKPTLPELEELDLRGVDFDRMTPEAREHYWFNVNKYARHLYVAACDISMVEMKHPYSPICATHVREAETQRLSPMRRRRNQFGIVFVLDALQILGAAACGALATRPTFLSAAGVLPLATALALTISVFIARETIAARD